MPSDKQYVLRSRILYVSYANCSKQRKPSVPSNDLVSSSTKFSAALQLLDELGLTSSRINYGLKCIDSEYYQQHLLLQEAVHCKYPHTRAINAVDPLVMEGRAIMWNRQTPLHPNRLDPPQSWAVLVCGPFQKDYLFIPHLNLRLRYQGGDMVFLQGGILPHEVEAWEGGQQVSLAHFTHKSLWDEFGLSLPI